MVSSNLRNSRSLSAGVEFGLGRFSQVVQGGQELRKPRAVFPEQSSQVEDRCMLLAWIPVHTIRYDGPVQMPPTGKLPDNAISALTTWVRMGAPWLEGRSLAEDPSTAATASKPDAAIASEPEQAAGAGELDPLGRLLAPRSHCSEVHAEGDARDSWHAKRGS